MPAPPITFRGCGMPVQEAPPGGAWAVWPWWCWWWMKFGGGWVDCGGYAGGAGAPGVGNCSGTGTLGGALRGGGGWFIITGGRTVWWTAVGTILGGCGGIDDIASGRIAAGAYTGGDTVTVGSTVLWVIGADWRGAVSVFAGGAVTTGAGWYGPSPNFALNSSCLSLYD